MCFGQQPGAVHRRGRRTTPLRRPPAVGVQCGSKTLSSSFAAHEHELQSLHCFKLLALQRYVPARHAIHRYPQGATPPSIFQVNLSTFNYGTPTNTLQVSLFGDLHADVEGTDAAPRCDGQERIGLDLQKSLICKSSPPPPPSPLHWQKRGQLSWAL